MSKLLIATLRVVAPTAAPVKAALNVLVIAVNPIIVALDTTKAAFAAVVLILTIAWVIPSDCHAFTNVEMAITLLPTCVAILRYGMMPLNADAIPSANFAIWFFII